MNELKPCPFCGGEARRIDIDATKPSVPDAGASYIACGRCYACSPIMFGEKTGLEESWNRRALSTIDPDAGTGWMIEASQELLKIHGLSAPAWWTGIDPNIDEIFSTDLNKGVRFSRKEDAERVIHGWGYSLENQWVFASDHRWG